VNFWRKEVIDFALDHETVKQMDEQREWIEREPTNARPYHNLAQLYRVAFKQDEALGLLLEAIRLDPAYADAHAALAEIYITRADDEAALLAFAQSLPEQDLLFTYSRDLDPWYRIPLGLINHAAVALGLIGLLLCFHTVHSAGNQTSRDAVALLAVMIAATWAMHVWTAVEMRFGFALLCALFPLAGYAIARVWQSASVRSIVSTTVVVAAYVAGALQLSSWVRDQSPLIHAIVTGQSSETAGDDGGRTSPGAVSR